MTTQEILASLSQLEQELQSIKSARILAEDTIHAYTEVKTDISKLLSEFATVSKSLNSLAQSFENENQILSDEIQNSINVVKGQLETLNIVFGNQCNSVILRFIESINSATDGFKIKIESFSSTYEVHNNTLKKRIEELSSVHNSLITATEYVNSLKSDIATLQKQLNDSQKEQDTILAKIASDLQTTSSNHTKILFQIANDLKTSQDAQDIDLDNIKESLASISYKLDSVISKIEKVSSLTIDKFSAIDSKIEGIISYSKINKVLVIVNILITIGVLIMALLNK